MIKDYEINTSFLIDSMPLFNTKAFISDKQKADKEFYTMLCGTQMFNYFLQQQESKEIEFFLRYYNRFKNKTIYTAKSTNSSSSSSSFEEKRVSEKLMQYSAMCKPDANSLFHFLYPKITKHASSILVNDYMNNISPMPQKMLISSKSPTKKDEAGIQFIRNEENISDIQHHQGKCNLFQKM